MTTATEFQAKVTKAGVNMDRLDAIVNGGPSVEVETDNGDVPSLAKLAAEFSGWSPVLAVVNDGARRVFQVTDWVTVSDSAGTKPPVGKYVGDDGLVTLIADAIDVRGPAGVVTSASGQSVSSTVSMAAIASPVAGQSAILTAAGRAGVFVFSSADLSAEVTLDTEEGIYIAPSSDATGASGAWVRASADEVNVKWFGATGDGVTDDTAVINAAMQAANYIEIPEGNFKVNALLEPGATRPMHIRGKGQRSVFIASGSASSAIRLEAIGGDFADPRSLVVVEDLTFKADGQTGAYSLPAIDAEAVHCIDLNRIVCQDRGPDAIKLKHIYYGSKNMELYLVNSGLTLDDVNAVGFHGDVRPNTKGAPDSPVDPTFGDGLFGSQSRYAVEAEDSDQIIWRGVFEGWGCGVIKLTRSQGHIFDGAFFEGNFGAHTITVEGVSQITFCNGLIDLGIHGSDCFLLVDNTIGGRTLLANITNQRLVLWSQGNDFAPPLVKTVGATKARVVVNGASLESGRLVGSGDVLFDVRSLLLTRSYDALDATKYFYSLPNAMISGPYNSWLPQSASADWDFTAETINFKMGDETAAPDFDNGLTFEKTSVAGQFLTGSRAIKIGGFTAGATKVFKRNGGAELGAIATGSGDTYALAITLMADRDCTIRLKMHGGFGFIEGGTAVEVKAGRFVTHFLKTNETSTEAQGKYFSPDMIVEVTVPSGGSAANLYVDRMDYAKVNGDHFIS